jgi:hypothetical protein
MTDPAERLHDLARKLYNRHKDEDKAAECMTKAIMHDVELYVVEPAAFSLICSHVHHERMRRLNKEPAQPKHTYTFRRPG